MSTAEIETTTEPIPTEFLGYWQRFDTPGMRRARRICRAVLRFDPIPDEEKVLAFAHGYYDWWRNEMGDRQSKFAPAEQLRR